MAFLKYDVGKILYLFQPLFKNFTSDLVPKNHKCTANFCLYVLTSSRNVVSATSHRGSSLRDLAITCCGVSFA